MPFEMPSPKEMGEATNIAGKNRVERPSSFRFNEAERQEKKEMGMSDEEIDALERRIAEAQAENRDRPAA